MCVGGGKLAGRDLAKVPMFLPRQLGHCAQGKRATLHTHTSLFARKKNMMQIETFFDRV